MSQTIERGKTYTVEICGREYRVITEHQSPLWADIWWCRKKEDGHIVACFADKLVAVQVRRSA